MLKVIEYVLLGLGVVSLYACGMILTRQVQLLEQARIDLDMTVYNISMLAGVRRNADIEIE